MVNVGSPRLLFVSCRSAYTWYKKFTRGYGFARAWKGICPRPATLRRTLETNVPWSMHEGRFCSKKKKKNCLATRSGAYTYQERIMCSWHTSVGQGNPNIASVELRCLTQQVFIAFDDIHSDTSLGTRLRSRLLCCSGDQKPHNKQNTTYCSTLRCCTLASRGRTFCFLCQQAKMAAHHNNQNNCLAVHQHSIANTVLLWTEECVWWYVGTEW